MCMAVLQDLAMKFDKQRRSHIPEVGLNDHVYVQKVLPANGADSRPFNEVLKLSVQQRVLETVGGVGSKK